MTQSIKANIEKYFGFFPPFFAPTLGTPSILENLWLQEALAHIKNPLPSLVRELLFARLSRYCASAYNLVVHSCALLPLGVKGQDIYALLKEPAPWSEDDLAEHFKVVEQQPIPSNGWPEIGTPLDKALLHLAEFVFLEPIQALKSQSELRRVLGSLYYDHLMLYLAYVKSCHFWTDHHPEISYEADQRYREHAEPLFKEEPRLRDFFSQYGQIVLDERRSLEDRLTAEIAQRRQYQEELTRYAGELEETRDRLQAQTEKLAAQTSELTTRREELILEVAERKQAEERIRIYMEIVKNMPIGLNVWQLDDPAGTASFRLVATNPAVRRFTGDSLESSVGKRMNEIFPYMTETPHLYYQVLQTQKAYDLGESPYVNDQGQDGAFFVRVFPLPNQCIGVTYNDLSDQKKAQEELARARDAALQLAQTRSDFLANMSHEIRTPLNAIVGMTNLLADTKLDGQQKELASTVVNASDALLGIINNILDFSKAESGKMTLEHVDFDLRVLLEGSAELLASRAQAKNLQVVVLVDPALPPVLKGDPTRLRQVFINLLTNAVKFTERGEVVLEARRLLEEGTKVVVRFIVKDTGIGITPEARKKLFNAFVQADASTTRKFGGTGLGLAISKRLVELMGGELDVDSEPGHGSSFWFDAQLDKGPVPAPLDTDRYAHIHILFFDENAANREMLINITSHWKLRAETAATGESALQALIKAQEKGDPFNVLIVDIPAPVCPGLALLKQLQEDKRFTDIHAIAMVPWVNAVNQDELFKLGLSASLTKPVKQSSLLDSLLTLTHHSAESPSLPLQPASPPEGTAKNSTLKILVVEDNPVNQRVGALVLRQLGYSPEFASSGAEALAKMDEQAFDLIFMDCQMPDMDGYETTGEIRKREAGQRRIPIIAMTANAMEGDREKCLQSGMDDYLPKPIRKDALAAMLGKWDVALDTSVLQSLREMAGTDRQFLVDLIDHFIRDTPLRLNELKEALSAGDLKKAERSAHTIRGTSGNLGAKGLWGVCEKVENYLRGGAIAQANQLLSKIDEEFQRLLPSLQREREKP